MENRFVFKVEWYDEVSSLLKNFQLTYFEKNETVELVRPFCLIYCWLILLTMFSGERDFDFRNLCVRSKRIKEGFKRIIYEKFAGLIDFANRN